MITRDTILAILDVHLSSHKTINGKGEAADRILAAREREREGEVVLGDGLFYWSEGCSNDSDVLYVGENDNRSGIFFDAISGKQGQLIFQPTKAKEAGLMKKEHLNYECEMAIPKEERERRLENKECLDCYKRLTSTPAPVASGLVKELKDNIEKAMKGITERQTQEDSYWRGYYNCLEETWDSLNVQISRYSKEAK